MSRHTPGPWTVSDNKDLRHRSLAVMAEAETSANRPDKIGNVEPGRALIASVSNAHVTNETMEANARLIAAAPDLLAVLRDALGELDYLSKSPESEYARPSDEILAEVRETIAKAEGNQ